MSEIKITGHVGAPQFDDEVQTLAQLVSNNSSGFTRAEAAYWISTLSASLAQDIEESDV